jgi:tetratricopeptide (TPR) repeat protein
MTVIPFQTSFSIHGPRRPVLRSSVVAIGIALAAATSVLAGSVTLNGLGPGPAVEIDEASRSILDVKQAIKSFEKRDFDVCLAQLTLARKAHPELPPPHALFAKLAFLSNQGPLIRPALESAIGEDPEHPEIFILFGNLALAEGRLTDASVHFEKARGLSAGKQWTADQRNRFDCLSLQGDAVVAESRGDWKAARAALAGWLKHEPGNAAARQRLGKSLFHVHEHDAAYAELEQAAKADGALEPPPITMAWLLTRGGNLKKAEEWINYANKTAPESLAVQMGSAAWLLEQGRGDEAATHAESAAKLDPKSIAVKRLMGLSARQRKDFGQAEQLFEGLAHDAPADAWIRNQLALALVRQTDETKRRRALALAELSVRQNPKAADSLATLGTVYFRLNRLDDAEKLLAAVFQNGQSQSDDVLSLARVLAARGKKDVVVPLLKKALAASGLFLERNEAKRWLEDLEKPKQ